MILISDISYALVALKTSVAYVRSIIIIIATIPEFRTATTIVAVLLSVFFVVFIGYVLEIGF